MDAAVRLEWMKSVPTLFIALVVAVISLNQWRVAKAKFKLDLFDKRYAIFQHTVENMSEVAASGVHDTKVMGIHIETTNPFGDRASQARFLFGRDIEQSLLKASKSWDELRKLQSIPEPNRLDHHRAEEEKLLTWFRDQAENKIKKTFGRYMNFERWS